MQWSRGSEAAMTVTVIDGMSNTQFIITYSVITLLCYNKKRFAQLNNEQKARMLIYNRDKLYRFIIFDKLFKGESAIKTRHSMSFKVFLGSIIIK